MTIAAELDNRARYVARVRARFHLIASGRLRGPYNLAGITGWRNGATVWTLPALSHLGQALTGGALTFRESLARAGGAPPLLNHG